MREKFPKQFGAVLAATARKKKWAYFRATARKKIQHNFTRILHFTRGGGGSIDPHFTHFLHFT